MHSCKKKIYIFQYNKKWHRCRRVSFSHFSLSFFFSILFPASHAKTATNNKYIRQISEIIRFQDEKKTEQPDRRVLIPPPLFLLSDSSLWVFESIYMGFSFFIIILRRAFPIHFHQKRKRRRDPIKNSSDVNRIHDDDIGSRSTST